MTDVIIDAPLLACPTPDKESKDQFDKIFTDYLQCLADVANLRLNCKTTKFWRDDRLPLALHEMDCYPFPHSLNLALSHLYDPSAFQIEDINRIAVALIDRSTIYEQEGEFSDIALDDPLIEEDVVDARPEPFSENILRQISLAMPILAPAGEFPSNMYLASGKGGHPSLRAKFVVELRERHDGTVCDQRVIVEGVTLKKLPAPSDFIKNVNLPALWAVGSESSVLDACMLAYARDNGCTWGVAEQNRKRLSVGPDFLASAKLHGFLHEEPKISRLLADCNDLLCRRNLNKTHKLRTGRGGSDPQVIRGVWRAWRHDVDYEYHLHYWRNDDEIILSKVVVHEDFSIT